MATGYWFLGRPERWRSPEDLVVFLEEGPPAYVGYRSMVRGDQTTSPPPL